MHRSMKESEPAHKVTNAKFESKIRSKESGQSASASQVHATELATVPGNEVTTNPAVKHSVGHMIERSSKPIKTLRRHR